SARPAGAPADAGLSLWSLPVRTDGSRHLDLAGVHAAEPPDLGVDHAVGNQLRERSLEGLHALPLRRQHDVADVVALALLDEVPHRVVRQEDLEGGDPAAADPRQELLV